MTRYQAHEILTAWKAGSQHFPFAVITAALIATGDLDARLAD
jgi:hypothetical protein